MRIVNGLFAIAILGVIAIMLPEPETMYRVRVNVVDAQGKPVDDAEATSSVGGEKQEIEGGWEFQIPDESLPDSRLVTFRVEREESFSAGRASVTLSKDYSPTVDVELRPDVSAEIAGIVVGEGGQAISGATVFVVGHNEQAVITSETGGFRLAAHKAPGQQVKLRAQADGYASTTAWHTAGSDTAELRLTPSGQ